MRAEETKWTAPVLQHTIQKFQPKKETSMIIDFELNYLPRSNMYAVIENEGLPS